MNTAIFKKSIVISTLCHLTVFNLFSFSSGSRMPQANYPGVSFFGKILDRHLLSSSPEPDKGDIKPDFFAKANTLFLAKSFPSPPQASYYLKPPVFLGIGENKLTLPGLPESRLIKLPKKESVVMFYPQLPYHFLLYFRDRQTVHIELLFNIISYNKTSAIAIKRKISSGNLEADLLSMRYLSHYLFIQQTGLPVNTWQSVKIELSPKND